MVRFFSQGRPSTEKGQEGTHRGTTQCTENMERHSYNKKEKFPKTQ